MAVVISASQNEKSESAAKGVDIAPRRTRMVNEDLDTSTIYLDKPMQTRFGCVSCRTASPRTLGYHGGSARG
jgi:hypothetical protein